MSTQHSKTLVLQGGGALGAYQAGAFESLSAQGYLPDWVIGTSIGAINGAIIAGNPVERRSERLREFWDMASAPNWQWAGLRALHDLMPKGMSQAWGESLRALPFLTSGVPGFFTPRQGALHSAAAGMQMSAPSFYDTSALQRTLEALVDFDYLNEKHPRFTACAVNVDTGERADFDTGSIRVDARHVMASGALPPGFPFVEIDGSRYWDGGIYSNTPIDLALEASRDKDLACVMIDLWNACDTAAPSTFAATATRQKDIVYASRVKEHLRRHRESQDLRRAIHELSELLTPAQRAKARALVGKGDQHGIHIARMLMPPLPGDGQSKDIDFSQGTVQARWRMGVRDGLRLAAHKEWLAPLPTGVGMSVHELPTMAAEAFSVAEPVAPEASIKPAAPTEPRAARRPSPAPKAAPSSTKAKKA